MTTQTASIAVLLTFKTYQLTKVPGTFSYRIKVTETPPLFCPSPLASMAEDSRNDRLKRQVTLFQISATGRLEEFLGGRKGLAENTQAHIGGY